MPVDKQKQTGAHFTPKPLADLVAARIAQEFWRIPGPVRILDPACGDGNLLLAIARSLPPDTLGRCTLMGTEDDDDSLHAARARMNNIGARGIVLTHGDFLDSFDGNTIFSTSSQMEPVDVIIANPPYVRTQVLGAERSRELAARFALAGRLDLYQAFLVAMTETLRSGGLIGVITSNRFLTTRSGESTRRYLRTHFDLLEIVDLGDSKLFDAAVLPALVFGVRREAPRAASDTISTAFTRVYSTDGHDHGSQTVESVPMALRLGRSGRCRAGGTVYEIATGRLDVPSDSSAPWTLHTDEEREWVSHVDAHAACRIRDVAKVRVGIKTTADKVFIRSDWDRLPVTDRPEAEYLRPLISQRNVARWRAHDVNGNALSVLYTHEIENGQRRPIKFPIDSGAWKYLLKHRSHLSAREYVVGAGRQWYEIWVPQNPAAWRLPKVVFPDISPEARFFLDRNGGIVDGNCYWITADNPLDEDLLLLILGVANSSTLSRYHALCFQNRLYAQRRRYLTQYVQRYPLPNRESPEANEIVRLVRGVIDERPGPAGLCAAEEAIDQMVARSFGLETAPVRDNLD